MCNSSLPVWSPPVTSLLMVELFNPRLSHLVSLLIIIEYLTDLLSNAETLSHSVIQTISLARILIPRFSYQDVSLNMPPLGFLLLIMRHIRSDMISFYMKIGNLQTIKHYLPYLLPSKECLLNLTNMDSQLTKHKINHHKWLCRFHHQPHSTPGHFALITSIWPSSSRMSLQCLYNTSHDLWGLKLMSTNSITTSLVHTPSTTACMSATLTPCGTFIDIHLSLDLYVGSDRITDQTINRSLFSVRSLTLPISHTSLVNHRVCTLSICRCNSLTGH